MSKGQKKCENCKHFKAYSHAYLARYTGIMAASFGLFLIWIPIIGLPLLILGVAFFVGSFAPKAGTHWLCRHCGLKWTE